MRTGWDRQALSVFFACRTPINNQHAHIDPMGFDFTAYGKALVVDPGRFTYRECDDRRYFKSAALHNTLTLDERDPFQYVSSWEYTPQKNGEIVGVYERPGFVAAAARHLNYEPVTHWRLVALVAERCLVVLDRLTGVDAASRAQIYFHADSTTLAWDVDTHAAVTHDAGANVAIFASPGLRGEVLPGRVSDFIDHERPSRRLRLGDADAPGGAERCYATLVVPLRPGELPPAVADRRLDRQGEDLVFAFAIDGTRRRIVWGPRGADCRAESSV